MLTYFGFYDTTPRSECESDQEEAVIRKPRSPQPTKPVVMAKAVRESSTALLR